MISSGSKFRGEVPCTSCHSCPRCRAFFRFGSEGTADRLGRRLVAGRYRDRASWAAQVELRQSFTKRWGGTAFLGVGGIAPSASGLLVEGNALPAAGIGVRYLPFKDNDVHLRLDVAVGKSDYGVYLGIGEAF